MTDIKQKHGPNQRFVKSWSMGMNDYEIAQTLGVDIETVRSVKKDLNLPMTEGPISPPEE